MKAAPPKGRAIDAGSKAYSWLKEALGVFGTAVTLIQLLPAAVTLVAVLLSPTAWLSVTLRRWVLAGALTGTVAGMVILARQARAGGLRRLLAGGLTARAKGFGRLAWWGLGTALVAAMLLRLHLALVDVSFVDRYDLLLPVFDFYLGGGVWAAILYNAAAGALSALAVAGLAAGGPAALLRWRERRAATRSLLSQGGALAGFDEALEALDVAKATLTAAQTRLVDLQVERDRLAALLDLAGGGVSGQEPANRGAAAELAAPGAAAQTTATPTSAPDRPSPRGPRAASGRAPR